MRRGSAQWVIWEWETLIAWISWVQQASLTVIPLVSVCECKCQNAVQPWGSLPGVCSDECFMSAWMERTVMRHMGKTDWTEDVHLTHKTPRLLRLERKRTIQIIFSCKVDDTLTKEQRVLKEAWGGLCVCVCVCVCLRLNESSATTQSKRFTKRLLRGFLYWFVYIPQASLCSTVSLFVSWPL